MKRFFCKKEWTTTRMYHGGLVQVVTKGIMETNQVLQDHFMDEWCKKAVQCYHRGLSNHLDQQ